MSYLVLARKYRPRNFPEMVGQEHVVQALTNALQTQRLHHAYLFTGTRGVGKTTVSRILAKSLNCLGPDGQGGITANPCGVCQACTDIDSGRFVDYTELDAASNRGIDDVLTLLEQAVYKPVQGRFKVFMIDEVHMLTGPAFNAMLKTLEEPPEYLKFVLATTDPQKVPVTVLSRCLQFNLRPMAPVTIREHLAKVLAAESVAAEPQALRLLARYARGSMRDALSLTDQAIAFGNGQLGEVSVRQMLGSVDQGFVFGLIEALAQGDGKTVVETSEQLRINGLSAASTLEEMAAALQRMAVWQMTSVGAGPSPSANTDEADPDAADVARLAQLMPPDETQLLYSLCLHGRAELGLAPDEYSALTMVLLRLLAFKPQTARLSASGLLAEKKTLKVSEALAQVAATAQVAQAVKVGQVDQMAEVAPMAPMAPVVQPAPAPAAAVEQLQVLQTPHFDPDLPVQEEKSLHVPVDNALLATKGVAIPILTQADSRIEHLANGGAGQALVPSEEGDFWHPLVQKLIATDAIAALTRELALQSQLVARDADQWLLRIERESLNQSGSRDRLQTALQAAGHAVKLVVEVGRLTDSPARRNAQASAERQQAAEKIILEDPFVQRMVNDFAAKIVPGGIRPM